MNQKITFSAASRPICTTAIWLTFAGFGTLPAFAGPLYHYTDLGTLGGPQSFARSVNSLGDVVGSADTASGDTHAFIYKNGVMTDLLGSKGGSQSGAQSINDAGQVAGFTFDSSGNSQAYMFQNNILTKLGTLGGPSSFAYRVNASGQIVGVADGASGHNYAFLYSNGLMKNLGTTGNTSDSEGLGLNDIGQAAGYVVGPFFGHAALFNNNQVTDLGTLGGSSSYARSISHSGQVTGYAAISSGRLHAFLYSSNHMTDIGVLPGAVGSDGYDINGSGAIVGDSVFVIGGVIGFERAFLYQNGKMIDLNGVLDNSTNGSVLSYAEMINDQGWIAGEALTPNGNYHAFLLRPVPEPSSLILLAIGALTVGGKVVRRRRRFSATSGRSGRIVAGVGNRP